MATPFESKDGLTWADQWDYNNSPSDASSHKQQQSPQNNQTATGKIKSAASVGVDKAKIAASSGAKKVKLGTNSGIQWIKEQYQKKTKK